MMDDDVRERDDVQERDDGQTSDDRQEDDERQERDEMEDEEEVADDDDVVGEESTAGTRLTCVACGAAIDPTEWHPVRSRIDAAGDLHIDTFCSAECRETVKSE